jgi:starvation-inducible DNA-binding protein
MRTPTRYKTRIGIREAIRTPMIALLNQQLADTFDLYSQTKHAHWNVRGAAFYQTHLLFDKLAEEVEGYVDLIAERAGALGGAAEGTARMSSARSRLPEFPGDCSDVPMSIDALASRFAAVGASTRLGVDTAGGCGDTCTADLLTQVARGLDAALWFLEAHLQSPGTTAHEAGI